MRVIEDESNEDRYGRCPIVFKGAKKLSEVHDWLFQNYNGYKFAIVFDETPSEWYPYGNDIYVYFLDEIAEEVAHYADMKLVKKY